MESLNDKRASCIILTKGLSTLIENFRCKILSLNDLQLLEEIMEFMANIHSLVYKVIEGYTKTQLSDYKTRASYFPRIIQARQMSIHSMLCSLQSMFHDLKKKKYFETCNKIFVLNHFLQTLKPSIFFLEDFLMSHPHFHVVLLVEPKNQRRQWTPHY